MAWYNASWLYRFKVTSDQTLVDEAIDNVYYQLANAPAAFWTHVRSDGGDIRVTLSDEVTEVAREVSGFSVGLTAGSLYFKATGLSASVNTDYYVYYGNAAATEPSAGSTFGKNNVWTSLTCVFHLDESGSPAVCSKTGTSAAQTGGVGFAAIGKLRGSCDFAGGDDELVAGNTFGITAAALTLSAWINPDAAPHDGSICGKCDTDNTHGFYWRLAVSTTTTEMRLVVGDNATNAGTNSDPDVIGAGTLTHVAVTYDGAFARFYVNGVLKGNTVDALTTVPTNSTGPFTIGNFPAFNFHPFVGLLDELRMATTVRSQNWITTEYNNQNAPGTFWTTAAEETGVTPSLLWLPRQMILRGPRGLMTPSGPVPPTRPEP